MVVNYSRMISFALIFLPSASAAAGLHIPSVGAATAPQGAAQFPACIIQLSDIHLSRNVEHHWDKFGDREGDLRMFISDVIPALGPRAVIISGDLTDSKTALGAGMQHTTEWEAYTSILEAFKDAGVPESTILDVRGNHDIYNVASQRGAHADFFARHSATGRRGASIARVHTHVLMPAKGVLSLEDWEKMDVLQGSGGRAEHFDRLSCPSAIIVGIDASPLPSTKNPLNFMGSSDALLVTEIENQIAAARAAAGTVCAPTMPSPLILSYGHYPLATIDHRVEGFRSKWWWSSFGIVGALLHASGSVHSIGHGIGKALIAGRVTAYLSGHLHTLFGERLHHLHRSSSSSSGMKPSSSGSVGGGGGAVAEIETGAWKDDRRFRVLVADPRSSSLAVADFYFIAPTAPQTLQRVQKRFETSIHPNTIAAHGRGWGGALRATEWLRAYEHRGWGILPADPTAAPVVDYIALITWPPDARYFPKNPGSNEESIAVTATQEEDGTIRAVVFPLMQLVGEGRKHADGSIVPGNSRTQIHVEVSGWLPDGTKILHAPMQNEMYGKSGDTMGMQVFSASPHATVHCVEAGSARLMIDCAPPAQFVDVQITIQSVNESSIIGASAKIPIALKCRPDGPEKGGRQTCWAAQSEEPAPMELSWVEWFILCVHWPVAGNRLFLLCWTLHMVFMLLIPRRLAVQGNVPRRISSSSWWGGTAHPVGHAGFGSWHSPELFSGIIRRLLQIILWPFVALVLSAGVRRVWLSMVLYSVYLLVGPLMLADVMVGHQPAVIFSYGMVGNFHGAGWEVVPIPDTLLISFVHLLIAIVPLTLWVACVVGNRVLLSRHPNRTSSKESDSFFPLWGILGPITYGQAASFILIMFVNWKIVYFKSLVMLGTVSLAISPGFGWVSLLALALVSTTRGLSRPPAGSPTSPKSE